MWITKADFRVEPKLYIQEHRKVSNKYLEQYKSFVAKSISEILPFGIDVPEGTLRRMKKTTYNAMLYARYLLGMEGCSERFIQTRERYYSERFLSNLCDSYTKGYKYYPNTPIRFLGKLGDVSYIEHNGVHTLGELLKPKTREHYIGYMYSDYLDNIIASNFTVCTRWSKNIYPNDFFVGNDRLASQINFSWVGLSRNVFLDFRYSVFGFSDRGFLSKYIPKIAEYLGKEDDSNKYTSISIDYLETGSRYYDLANKYHTSISYIQKCLKELKKRVSDMCYFLSFVLQDEVSLESSISVFRFHPETNFLLERQGILSVKDLKTAVEEENSALNAVVVDDLYIYDIVTRELGI